MKVQKLLTTDLGTELSVSNEPFMLQSKLTLRLEGGVDAHWLFAENGAALAINPETEEMLFLRPVEKEIEHDDEVVVESGKDYEFSYEDRGFVEALGGEGVFDEGDELEFMDYEAGDGDRVRIVTNTYNGEERVFVGNVVTEEDIVNGA
jgi:hypothetical protein